MGDNATTERIRRRLTDAGILAPRYRHFQRRGGALYCWTVEPDFVDTCPRCRGVGDYDCEDCEGSGKDHRPGRGWYYSFIYRPVGPGSRSGNAEQWAFNANSVVRHRKRNAAKARAERLFQAERGHR